MEFFESVHPPPTNLDISTIQMNPDESIERIMDIYGEEIKRLVYTYVKNTADTDDVTQEIFVTVYQKIHTFKGNSSLKSWIYSIAINKCKDYLRSWQSRNRRLKEKLMQAVHVTETVSVTPEDVSIHQAETNELLQQVMELPLKYREIIILYYFKEFTTKEVSELIRLNEATVRTRLTRGREKLKQLLATERGVNHG